MRQFSFFFLVVALMAQAPQMNINKLLGSGREDLWVFGVNADPKDKSVEIQLRSRRFPKESWGTLGTGNEPGTVLYSERPRSWDWEHSPASRLKIDQGDFHLSKYDDQSAFAADWGVGRCEDGTYFNKGTIVRYEEGHLRLVPDALKLARLEYGLSEKQNFLGMVSNKIFYFDPGQSDRIFFFEKGHLDQRFEVIVLIHPIWPRSWKLASAEQVFEGEKPDEVLVYIWVHNTAWMSAKPRRESMGVSVDLKAARSLIGKAK